LIYGENELTISNSNPQKKKNGDNRRAYEV